MKAGVLDMMRLPNPEKQEEVRGHVGFHQGVLKQLSCNEIFVRHARAAVRAPRKKRDSCLWIALAVGIDRQE